MSVVILSNIPGKEEAICFFFRKAKSSSSSSSSSLLFDIVHEKKGEHKSITVQKDVKEHRITVTFSSQGAPFNSIKF